MEIEIKELTKNQEKYFKLKEYYKKYRENHKTTQKEYNDNHKDERKEYHKNRYLNIKEKMLLKNKCICGAYICSSAMKRHILTDKHNYYLALNELMINNNNL